MWILIERFMVARVLGSTWPGTFALPASIKVCAACKHQHGRFGKGVTSSLFWCPVAQQADLSLPEWPGAELSTREADRILSW